MNWRVCYNPYLPSSNVFRFFYLAKDSDRTAEGEVIPGIGGMIYERLGSNGQTGKNEYVPKIMNDRRARFRSSIAG